MTLEHKPYLEIVPISSAMRDLIKRRIKWIGVDLLNFNRSIEYALATAYIAGMSDAIDVLGTRALDLDSQGET